MHNSTDDNNNNLLLVIPADLTSVRLHKLFTKLSNWEVMLGSIFNADGAVYQTCQELFRVSELIAIQSMCLEKMECHTNYIFL